MPQANFARVQKLHSAPYETSFRPKMRSYEPLTGVYICEYIMTQEECDATGQAACSHLRKATRSRVTPF
jgi:hypothetical protein